MCEVILVAIGCISILPGGFAKLERSIPNRRGMLSCEEGRVLVGGLTVDDLEEGGGGRRGGEDDDFLAERLVREGVWWGGGGGGVE